MTDGIMKSQEQDITILNAKKTWKDIKHFSWNEFDSPDIKDSGLLMNIEFVKLLDELRQKIGLPLIVSNGGGYITQAYNLTVNKSAKYSDHMKGFAVDFLVEDSDSRYKILKAAFELVFVGYGVYDRHVHLDMDFESNKRCWVGK